MSAVSTEHIATTPGTCGGKPRIAGTRVRVQDVVAWHERMRMSVEEIVGDYPHPTRADVYAALAYYHDQPEEVRSLLAAGDELADALEAEQPSILDKIAARRDAPR